MLQVLDTHRAHGVQDGDDRHTHVAKDGEPHIGDAERREHQNQQLNAQRKDDVLPNNRHGLARHADRAGDVGRLVVHEHDVGSLNCGVRAHGAHGNANVCAGEHGCVVDAVTDKGELALAALGCKQRLDALDLIAWHELRVKLVEPQLLGHRRRNLLAVAREHDGAFDAGSVQVANRLLGIGLYGVGNYDMAGVRVIDQYMEDRTDDLAIGSVDTGRSKHLALPTTTRLPSMVAVKP